MIDATYRVALWIGYRLIIAWAFVRRPHISGAHVCVRRPSPSGTGFEVLLVRNSYKTGVTVPCGGIKRRESPSAAAVRELYEEVGIRVAEDALVAETEITLDYMWRTDHAHFFRLDVGADDPVAPRVDRREVVWGEFVDESRLGEYDLVPHVRAYLAWRDGSRHT